MADHDSAAKEICSHNTSPSPSSPFRPDLHKPCLSGPHPSSHPPLLSSTAKSKRATSLAMAVLLSILYLLVFNPSQLLKRPLPDFSHLASHCAHVQPIPAESFIERQDTLARTLHDLGASAYIAEPGANAAFYANLSGSAWHLSERPLLLIITPTVDDNNRISGNLSVFTPSFESTRARLLPVPSAAEIAYPEWPEDADPYEVAVSAIPGLKSGTVFVDGNMRQFVTDGLQKAVGGGTKVVSAPVEVRRLRERKSREEIEVMKCVNEVSRNLVNALSLSDRKSHLGNSARRPSCSTRNVRRHAGIRGTRPRHACPQFSRPD